MIFKKSARIIAMVLLVSLIMNYSGAFVAQAKQPSYETVVSQTVLGNFSENLYAFYAKLTADLDNGDLDSLKTDMKAFRQGVKDIRKDIDSELALNEEKLKQLNAKSANERHDQLKTELNSSLSGLEVILEKLDTAITALEEININNKADIEADLDALGNLLNPEQPQQALGALPHNNASVTPTEPAIGAGIAAAYMPSSVTTAASLTRTPTAEDLAETPETLLTQQLKDLADSLGSTVAIYEYVKNNVDYKAYYGSRNGAAATLDQMEGNDYDQASLLIAMLRFKGIPSRYITGTIEIPIARAEAWTGAQTPQAAVEALSALGIPTVAVVSGGTISAVRLEHVWVEAYVPYENYRGIGTGTGKKIWVPLDPSFKQYDSAPGLDIKAIAGITDEQIIEACKINADRSSDGDAITNVDISSMSSLMDSATAKVQQYITDNGLENADAKQLIGLRKIVPEKLGLLPLTLPYKTITVLSETNSVPEASSEKIGFSIRGSDPFNLNFGGTDDFNVDFRAVELYGKRITLSWIPATQEDTDIINSYGGISNTPAYMIQLKPQLKANGQVIAEGKAVGYGYRQQFTIAMGHVGSAVENVTNSVTAGGLYSIAFDFGKIAIGELDEIKDRISSLKNTATEENIYTDEVMGEILNCVGKTYFGQLDALAAMTANSMNVSTTRQISEAMTGYSPKVSYMFFVPVEVAGGSFFIDVDHDVYGVTSLDGHKENEIGFMMTSGAVGSAMEHVIYEQIFQIPSVSTIKILNEASSRGIPIYTLNKDNISKLSEISASSAVKKDITNAVNSGKVVTIPQSEIRYYDWTGSGYIIMDPETGAAGYMISGGLAGGSTSSPIAIIFKALVLLLTTCADILNITIALMAATNPVIIIIYFALLVLMVAYLESLINNLDSYLQTGNSAAAWEIERDYLTYAVFNGVGKFIGIASRGAALWKNFLSGADDLIAIATRLGDDLAEPIIRISGIQGLPMAETVLAKLDALGVARATSVGIANKGGLEGLEKVAEAIEMGNSLKTISSLDETLAAIGRVSFKGLDDAAIKTMLKNIDDGIMLVADKVTAKASLFNKALADGVKSDALVVAKASNVDAAGNIKWPTNPPDGFAVPNPPSKTLEVGTVIDRYGSPYGSFTSPVGTPFAERALPYIDNPGAYHKYRVIKPIEDVKYGDIAPVFGEVGGGTQFKLPDIVDNLLGEYLEEIF